MNEFEKPTVDPLETEGVGGPAKIATAVVGPVALAVAIWQAGAVVDYVAIVNAAALVLVAIAAAGPVIKNK